MTGLFGDREVITREPAYLTTAFGKKLPKPKEVKGVCRALLSDDSTVYLCEQDDYAHEDIQPVIRHLSKHAPSSRKYSPEAQATILRYREMEHARSRQGWAERVAARLNKEGKITRKDGTPWLAANVASLTQQWIKEDGPMSTTLNGVTGVAAVTAMVTHPDTPKIIAAIANAPKRSGLYNNLDADLRARMAETTDPAMTAKIIHDLVDLLTEQASTVKPCGHDDYDDLKAKAAMLDQMRSFMGEGK